MMLCCNKKSWIYNEVFPPSNIFTAIKTYFFQLMHLAEKNFCTFDYPYIFKKYLLHIAFESFVQCAR